MHKVNPCIINITQRELEDIVFIEADAKWVHHPYNDALVIMIKITNSNVHRMLVDNGSAVNIFYWDACKRMGLKESDLISTTSFLYGFTWDHVIPKGAIKLAMTVGEHL